MSTTHPTFTSCPWCTSRNPWGALECRRCGGPQPVNDVADPGPKPPPPPRKLPRGYGWQLFITGVTGLVGAIFLFVGLPFVVIFPVIGIATEEWAMVVIGGLLGGLFAILGVVFLVLGLRSIQQKRRIYQHGQATTASVIEVHRDTSIAVNGRNPWKVIYNYRVMATPYTGEAHAWTLTVEEGSPLHVLYLPDDPAHSAVFPPLGSRKG